MARAPSKPKPAEPAPSPKEEPAPKSRAKVERVEEPSKGAGGKPSVLSAVTRPQESPSKRPRPSGEVPGPPASPKAAGVPGGRYAVQVAACRRSPCTRRVRAKLKKEGLRSYVTVSKSRKFLLVRVGPYPTFKQARAVLQRLKKKGYKDPFVLKR
ncbi:MAG: SPOR domain-containing protein [Nitrospinota bacterium]